MTRHEHIRAKALEVVRALGDSTLETIRLHMNANLPYDQWGIGKHELHFELVRLESEGLLESTRDEPAWGGKRSIRWKLK